VFNPWLKMKPGALKSLLESRRAALVCVLLAGATLAVYWQVSGFAFTNFDDPGMVLNNPMVLRGLTARGLSWALTTSWFEYWHPLTWLSHMLDCELFGLNAGGHHLVSVGFHSASTLLLFAVLRRMTGALWRSAIVAALFALHPLHVESVAWIAERKDVLSGFFFMLTLWAYVRYAEKSKVGIQESGVRSQNPASGFTFHATRNTQHATRFYLLSLFFFACGLMSKPMLVTLPFLLLLLDFWPLQRYLLAPLDLKPSARTFHPSSFILHPSSLILHPLLLEKLPFFLLSVASCAITCLGVKAGGNIISTETVPWGLRLANMPVAYARYLGKMFWPVKLIPLYPLPNHWAAWQVGGALVVLGACSLLAVALVRRQPWLAVGWFWYLGTLVPVIGLLQVGHQAIADRYTYLPLVGIFMAVVWAAAEWGGSSRCEVRDARCEVPGSTFGVQRSMFLLPHPSPLAPPAESAAAGGRRLRLRLGLGLGGGVVVLCGYLAWVQTGYWRNSLTLWGHALAVTANNAAAQLNYGLAVEEGGQRQEAMEHYREALRIDPNFYEAHNDLGRALYLLGQLRESTNHLMQAVRILPDKSAAHVNLGRTLAALGDWSGAREQYEAALAAEPMNPDIPTDWGKALLAQNRATEARDRFAQALQLDPKFPAARAGYGFALSQLGAALAGEGKLAEAAGQYREALRVQPDLPEVLNNLAWLLATANDDRLRNGAEAVRLAQRACALTQYQQPLLVGTLAAAYAGDGRFEAARSAAQQAIALAEAAGQSELAARNRELLHLYEAGKPCRQ
jgi:tetratricopeptide (TPR) repeat protein